LLKKDSIPIFRFLVNDIENPLQLCFKSFMKYGIILILVLMFLFSANVSSHPHVFIDSSLTIVFDKKGLTGFKVRWVFDEMFSSIIIHDFDENGNGKFETSEVKKLKEGAFSNLKNFDYFTIIKIRGQDFKVKYIRDFSSSIRENIVVYDFFVPCHVSGISTFKEVRILFCDKENYSYFSFIKDKPVQFENSAMFDFQYQLTQDKEYPDFFCRYVKQVTLRFRKKNG
jgi:ABC-type uncharacterized transport system substrate-binding protein